MSDTVSAPTLASVTPAAVSKAPPELVNTRAVVPTALLSVNAPRVCATVDVSITAKVAPPIVVNVSVIAPLPWRFKVVIAAAVIPLKVSAAPPVLLKVIVVALLSLNATIVCATLEESFTVKAVGPAPMVSPVSVTVPEP